MITETITERAFFLPEDGDEARKEFLELLTNPGETWLGAYGFTLQPLFDEIKAADARGVPIHLLLDHTQACGHAEAPKLKDLALSLKHGDLTITTAGLGSRNRSAIWHWKSMVVLDPAGGEPWCVEGSVNLSESGFEQGNSMRIFRSWAWAKAFITQFTVHRAWAREHEPQYTTAVYGLPQPCNFPEGISQCSGFTDSQSTSTYSNLPHSSTQASLLMPPSILSPMPKT